MWGVCGMQWATALPDGANDQSEPDSLAIGTLEERERPKGKQVGNKVGGRGAARKEVNPRQAGPKTGHRKEGRQGRLSLSGHQ